jgi:poly(A) polymerase
MAGMTSLPDGVWRDRPGIDRLLAALDGDAGAVRFVGGMVRDGLSGIASHDIDCATSLMPDAVMARLKQAGIRAVPTGIAHGTVTAVLDGGPVEVTTLRRDVSTDGRRATVAFTDDWREDAARRDFTINALSADPRDGMVHDYFGGLDDLAAGRVRFIGDPLTRIAEDHLRILRFFRFHARFGRGAPDADALAACAARANDLMALSRERIADELLKLLALPDPAATVALMVTHGIFRPVLPEITSADPLPVLIAAERAAGIDPDGLRRFGALLPPDAATARAVAERLKLSRAQAKRLADAAAPAPEPPRHMAYRIGAEAARDWLLRTGDATGAALLAGWERPKLPIGGGDLIALGLTPGPTVAAALARIEQAWIAADFPDEAWVHAEAKRVVEGSKK